MRVAIVTNLNGIGLQRDFELLRDFLSPLGHEVIGIQYDAQFDESMKYDLAIFLEVMPRGMMELAPVKWAFLNPEWCVPETVKLTQRHMDRVFAKTFDAERVLHEAFGDKVYYTGFLTRDQYDPSIPRRPHFLHIGGNSSMRGTQALIDAFRWERKGKLLDAQLTIIGKAPKNTANLSKWAQDHITFLDSVSEDELKLLQNRCLIHIYPSGTEGFGHAMREALGVGAFLITTDAPPMNELSALGAMIKTCGVRRVNLADVWDVSALDVYEAMDSVQNILRSVNPNARAARLAFEASNSVFQYLFSQCLKDIKPMPAVKKREKSGLPQIAFIGNFHASESTENMIRWALEERLGYDVELLQENEVNLPAIRTACDFSEMLIWVRTPGWLRVPDRDMDEFLAGLKIPSVSIHLDKFWGIPEREKGIGKYPFWKTKFVCTADGSRQKDFRERGVNHFWMKPAVSEVYCHPGTPRDHFRCDVGFVGAKDYHTEYPFRKRMVEALEEWYGDRFKHITGVRGHELNDFYASCKVVVGDCIFAGTPRYWSDRVPETCGRGGFLLHPYVEGLTIPVADYTPQDLEDLHEAIEFNLGRSHADRNQQVRNAAAHVKNFDTWTVRLVEIMGTVNAVKHLTHLEP